MMPCAEVVPAVSVNWSRFPLGSRRHKVDGVLSDVPVVSELEIVPLTKLVAFKSQRNWPLPMNTGAWIGVETCTPSEAAAIAVAKYPAQIASPASVGCVVSE